MFERPTMPDVETDLVIIGAGVSGLTIAENILDYDLDFWIIGSPYESQLAKAGELQNTTKIEEGTVGLKHIEKKVDQLKENGLNLKTSLCTGLEINDNITVKTKYQDFITSKVIIATGCKQPKLGFPGEEKFFRNGISDCAVCDFPLFKGKPVAVIGNHKYTKNAAELLKRETDPVYLLWYKEDNPPKIDGIETYKNVNNLEVTGDEEIESLTFTSDNGDHQIKVKGIFIEGKPKPSTQFLDESKIRMENNFIQVNDKFETNIENIWAVGDVTGNSSSYDEAHQQAQKLSNILFS